MAEKSKAIGKCKLELKKKYGVRGEIESLFGKNRVVKIEG